MANPLRDRCSVAELAAVSQVVEISDKIVSFDGLVGIIEADLAALDPKKMQSGWRESAVLGKLQFGFADVDGRLPMVAGSVRVTVAAVCQRCLEPFRLPLLIEPRLLLLTSEQEADGYDEFEVWELDEKTIRLQDIVEELLIMALPFSAKHDNMAECRALASDDDEGGEDLVRPFAELRLQMTQNKTDPDD